MSEKGWITTVLVLGILFLGTGIFSIVQTERVVRLDRELTSLRGQLEDAKGREREFERTIERINDSQRRLADTIGGLNTIVSGQSVTIDSAIEYYQRVAGAVEQIERILEQDADLGNRSDDWTPGHGSDDSRN